MSYPRAITVLFCLLLTAISVKAQDVSPVLDRESRELLDEWLSIDLRFPVDAARTSMEADATGQRYRVEFTSDDGQRVNGVLAMPADVNGPVPLALALHPMGTDLTIWARDDTPLFGDDISTHLRSYGYAVLALDARLHGERKLDGIGPREIIALAHGENPRPYHQMIANSVRDYRLALRWADEQPDLDTSAVFATGYSMGAQMTLLLASVEPRISSVLVMVPPYVERERSPVAPRNHVDGIERAAVTFLAARNDPYSSMPQTRQVFDAIASTDKHIQFFDSKHVLPPAFLAAATGFIDRRAHCWLPSSRRS
ncbi:MAG: alpha/beta fold hydrolase, partial [Pseudomonadota bacterium]